MNYLMLNILIRTSNRPQYFKKCIESIKMQTNQNYKIIVGCDNIEDDYFKEFEHVIYQRKPKNSLLNIHTEFSTIAHFPFNSYFNEMYKLIETGFIMFLDDDDCFNDVDAIDKILNNVSQNESLFWRVDSGGKLVPSDANMNKRPVERDISMIGICFHSKWIPLLQFDEYKRGDYRIASRIYDLMNVKYLNDVLTRTQDVQHLGNRQDLHTIKVIVLIPVWKRPNILRKCIKSLKNIKKVAGISVKYYFIVSNDDPFLTQNIDIIKGFSQNIIEFANYPVSDKMNAGIRYINDLEKYDYIMNLGSDDIVNPDIFSIYKPYIDKKIKYFGVNSFIIKEKDKCMLFKYHLIVGGARMIHFSIIRKILMFSDLYPKKSDSGLDTQSHEEIVRKTNNKGLVIECEPLILDLKSDTNINCFEMLEFSELTTDIKFSEIRKYFKL